MRTNYVKTISFALALSLFFTLFPCKVYADSSLTVQARAAALYEPETNTFLYQKNASERLPMASTTKIMTALIAIERSNLNDIVCVDPRAVGVEGSSAYLQEGELFTVRELLYALMLRSANDAAEAIAYHIAGSVEAFASLMNVKAVALGLKDTHFTNPHGLDDDDHYTSAHDLALIAASALTSPEFSEIVSTRTKKVEKNDITRIFTNHNKLLSRYDGCIGIKTGFTKKSGRCLVGAAERNGIKIISVTIDSPNDWNEHEKMFDYAFSLLERITLTESATFEYSLPILNAEKPTIKLGISEDAKVIHKKTDPPPTIEIALPRFLIAPITHGQKVGKMLIKKGNKVILETDIIAIEEIKAKRKRGFLGLF